MKFKSLGILIFASAGILVPALNAAAEPVSAILRRAAAQLGTPYRSGGTAPGGFDCSGFVSYLYRPTLPELPRLSRDQVKQGVSVNPGEWEKGDLLFYATGANPHLINHVAVYYGQNNIIHSISDGPETGVVITPLSSRYWNERYITARRVLPEDSRERPGSEPDRPSAAGAPGKEAQPELPPQTPEDDSPWNNFDGILRGDFESWKAEEDEAFEAWKRENG